MSKSSKYVLAAGCSYTDKNFTSSIHKDFDVSFAKWPEIFGEYKSLPVKNLGASGVGNDYITSNLTQHILKDHKNIDTVIVGWTDVWRFCVYNHYKFNPLLSLYSPNKQNPQPDEAARPLYEYMFKKDLIDSEYSLFNLKKAQNVFIWQVKAWFKGMWQIQELCKAFDIKFIMAPLCGRIDISKFKQVENSFNNKLPFSETQWTVMYGGIEELYELDSNHYIGFPFMAELGGNTFNEILEDHHIISNLDLHPNAEGHEFIARNFYEHYTKVYS